jgi:hypothetical protein
MAAAREVARPAVGLASARALSCTVWPIPLHCNRSTSQVAIVIGLVFMGIGIGLGGQSWVQAIVLAIGVVVATVPEGLLVTFTVSLALTARRMHAGAQLLGGASCCALQQAGVPGTEAGAGWPLHKARLPAYRTLELAALPAPARSQRAGQEHPVCGDAGLHLPHRL